MPALVSTLRELFMRFDGSEALISATYRSQKTLDAFMNACCKLTTLCQLQVLTLLAANHLSVERLQVPLPNEGKQRGFFFPTTTPIFIFLISGHSFDSYPSGTSPSEASP